MPKSPSKTAAGADPLLTTDELAQLWANESKPPPDDPKPAVPEFWLPPLSPKQLDVFYDETDNLLVPGMRFTGKGWACGYNAVRHAYDYYNALVLVVVKTKRQGSTGGFFSKLGADILPDFERNVEGFKFRGPYMTIEKDVVFSVTNRYGGQSLIQMISILHDQDLKRKIKGIEASKVYIDEITIFETDEAYTYLRGTLKRRRWVPKKVQTLIGSCNPDDPKHWVAEKWGLEFNGDGTLNVEASNAKDSRFKVIEILKEDNPDPDVAEYYASLAADLKKRPTEYARDVEGKWVAMPQGDAIFKEHFVPDFHVRGSAETREYLHPRSDITIDVGWDPGDVNHGVIFLQEVPTREKILWPVFDEVVYVGKKLSLETLTDEVMRRMNEWCELAQTHLTFRHISDKSAFDRFRAASGSYDHAQIQKISATLLPKYRWLKAPIVMKECPKPDGSVQSRTRIVMELLSSEQLYISAKCPNLIETLGKITSKKDDPFAPDTRHPLKHAFDALTYPLFYHRCGGVSLPSALSGVRPMIIRAGS